MFGVDDTFLRKILLRSFAVGSCGGGIYYHLFVSHLYLQDKILGNSLLGDRHARYFLSTTPPDQPDSAILYPYMGDVKDILNPLDSDR